jgi:5-(carboxyamino)imidazole ribonucleotide mutase
MPPGVPVATVAIDGAENAAILAVQILALNNPGLKAKLAEMKRQMKDAVTKKDLELESSL